VRLAGVLEHRGERVLGLLAGRDRDRLRGHSALAPHGIADHDGAWFDPVIADAGQDLDAGTLELLENGPPRRQSDPLPTRAPRRISVTLRSGPRPPAFPEGIRMSPSSGARASATSRRI
jgi:hypothetical protein